MKTNDYSDLKAIFFNNTLKKSPDKSHTEGLIEASQAIMHKNGVKTEVIRAIDHDIATGVYPDMTEHGWKDDEWPKLYKSYGSRHPRSVRPNLAW